MAVKPYQVLLPAALTLILSNAALAQGSVTLHKGQLQPADKFPVARRQIQIIDESPIVTDLRRAPSQDSYQVEVGPAPTAAPGRTFVIKASGPGSLQPAGFGTNSNIPSGGMAPKNALPQTKMGHMPTATPPVRSIGASAPAQSITKTATRGNIAAPPAVAEYAHTPSRGLLTGSSSGSSSAHPEVRGTLLGHK